MQLINRDRLAWRKFQMPKLTYVSRGNGKQRALIERVYQKGWNDAIDTILEKEPVVEERPKGEWSFNPYDSCSYCSLCKVKAPFGYKNFCPNCGAEMKGEENG